MSRDLAPEFSQYLLKSQALPAKGGLAEMVTKGSGRGGVRPGAGRRKGNMYGEPTVVMRIPLSKVDRVRDLLADSATPEPTCPLVTFVKPSPFTTKILGKD